MLRTADKCYAPFRILHLTEAVVLFEQKVARCAERARTKKRKKRKKKEKKGKKGIFRGMPTESTKQFLANHLQASQSKVAANLILRFLGLQVAVHKVNFSYVFHSLVACSPSFGATEQVPRSRSPLSTNIFGLIY